MTVSLKDVSAGAGDEAIREFEVELGRDLPEQFRAFLAQNDGAKPEVNEFRIPDAENSSGVNEFYSIVMMRRTSERLSGRIPDGSIPIAAAEGGNEVLLLSDGTVAFWDHEFEDRDPTFVVAQTFGEFLNGLKPADPDEDLPTIKQVWVHPDFRK